MTENKDSQRWLVRVEGSGVWLGARLAGHGALPGTFRLEGARRAHYWEGAIDCSELARSGPSTSGSRITEETTVEVRLDRILEAQPMSSDALAQLDKAPVSRASKGK